MKPKEIPVPQFKSARKLKPLELNALHYENKHTVITPELLAEMSKR